jgi:hypothetical protein
MTPAGAPTVFVIDVEANAHAVNAIAQPTFTLPRKPPSSRI